MRNRALGVPRSCGAACGVERCHIGLCACAHGGHIAARPLVMDDSMMLDFPFSAMPSPQPFRTAGIGAAIAALLALAGCASEAPPTCEGEAEAVTSDGRVVVQTRAPVDVTAQGALSGKPIEGPRPMKGVLLLDFSGSMYGGYSRDAIANCERCRASAKRRNRQPYYFGEPEFQTLIADLVRGGAPAGTDLELAVLLFNQALYDVVPGRPKKDGGVVRKIARLDKVDLKSGRAPQSKLPKVLAHPIRVSEHAGDVESVLRAIPKDPIKFDRKAAQQTHLAAAVASARELIGDDGIIWLVTDNINDEPAAGTSEADALRNLAFYDLLKSDPRLQAVFAYPLFDAEQCTFMCGTSLFTYGIHVSSRNRTSAREVNRMSGNHLKTGPAAADGVLWNPKLQAVAKAHKGRASTSPQNQERVEAIAGVPLRLKPVDLDVVSISFEKNERGRVQPLKCRKTAEFGDKIPCVATLVVRNNLRHQTVRSGTIVIENDVLLPRADSDPKRSASSAPERLKWAGAVCKNDIKMREISPQEANAMAPKKAKNLGFLEIPLRSLPPGSERKIQLLVMVPSVKIAPTSIAEVFDTAFVDTVLLDGTIHARVIDVTTALAVPPSMRKGVYGAAGLPIIFRTQSQSEIRVDFPAQVPLHNDGKLRALLLFVCLGLLGLLLFLIVLRFQRARVTVFVDGVEHAKLSLPRISRRAIERGATEIGSARRGMAGKVRFVPKKGIQAKRSGNAWVLSGGGLSDCRVELRNGWSRGTGGSSRRSSGSSQF